MENGYLCLSIDTHEEIPSRQHGYDGSEAWRKENTMSQWMIDRQLMEDKKCPGCDGTGKQNDYEGGDTRFDEWVCLMCDGTGYRMKSRRSGFYRSSSSS